MTRRTKADDAASEAELSFLRDVVGMLPAGVTVQDAQGRFCWSTMSRPPSSACDGAAAHDLGSSAAKPARELLAGRADR